MQGLTHATILTSISLQTTRARGGVDEERAERQRCRDTEEAERRRNFEWLQELRRSGFRKVRGVAFRLMKARITTSCTRPPAYAPHFSPTH